jgi:hypothetical protein
VVDETEYRPEKSNLQALGRGSTGIGEGFAPTRALLCHGWMSHKMSHMSPALPPPAVVIVSAAALQKLKQTIPSIKLRENQMV